MFCSMSYLGLPPLQFSLQAFGSYILGSFTQIVWGALIITCTSPKSTRLWCHGRFLPFPMLYFNNELSHLLFSSFPIQYIFSPILFSLYLLVVLFPCVYLYIMSSLVTFVMGGGAVGCRQEDEKGWMNSSPAVKSWLRSVFKIWNCKREIFCFVLCKCLDRDHYTHTQTNTLPPNWHTTCLYMSKCACINMNDFSPPPYCSVSAFSKKDICISIRIRNCFYCQIRQCGNLKN